MDTEAYCTSSGALAGEKMTPSRHRGLAIGAVKPVTPALPLRPGRRRTHSHRKRASVLGAGSGLGGGEGVAGWRLIAFA